MIKKCLKRTKGCPVAGKDNKVILRNARLILEKGVPMIIRIPLIPGINDHEESLNEMALFVSGLNDNLHVDCLPYHRLGENKYKMLDRPYQLAGKKPFNEEQLRKASEIFKDYNLDVAIQE